MRPLPVGTLTLLFSDVEGSTALLRGLGDRWGEALSAQREILRDAFARHDGHELGTEGDSFFVVFASATEAVAAAAEAQTALAHHAWPGDRPLRVRMGLHTGEPQRHEDGYIGLDVHRAARIAATAHGGQTVISASTEALVTGALGEVQLRDLGWHRLKDLADPEHLFDLVLPGLPVEQRPLRSLGVPANLPAYGTPIVGREAELAAVTGLLTAGARLVTLTGPGGTGKTRLAVTVAGRLQDHVPTVFFVPLHTADRASSMWAAIAEAVGAPADAEGTPRDRVLAFLRDRPALLVLDNLEQIPDADVGVSTLLSEAPGVQLLATSRRPLHLIDEQQFPVPTLAVPDDGEETAAGTALDLFVQRARLVRPGFTLTAETRLDAAELCRRLDGLPLAIELAAARLRLLSPRALLGRLDVALRAAAPSADRAERQQTLESTIAWSYDMLGEDDRRVLRQLGVFSGKADLEAVATVVDAPGRDPLDAVAHLVDASLVDIIEAADGEPMVSLMETIRRFARDRLEESGELDAVRLRHAAWCLEVADSVSELLLGPRQMSALDRMALVEEDVRAALDWALDPAASPGGERRASGFALLRPMDTYWYRFGHNAEGRAWHDRALDLIDHGGEPDSTGVLDALLGCGIMTVQQNDLDAGIEVLQRALEMARRLGDVEREARASNSLGIARRESGDVAAARVLIEHGIELARSIGNRDREAVGLANVVHLHLDVGDYAGAVEAARRAIAADRELGNPWGMAISRINLVAALLLAEGPHAAYHQLLDAGPEAVALGDVELSIDVVESFSAVLAAHGDGVGAATMLGSADAAREQTGIARPRPEQDHLDRFLGPARAATDPDGWDRAYARGRSLSVEDAAAEGAARGTLPAAREGSEDAQDSGAADLYVGAAVHQTANQTGLDDGRAHGPQGTAPPVVGGAR